MNPLDLLVLSILFCSSNSTNCTPRECDLVSDGTAVLAKAPKIHIPKGKLIATSRKGDSINVHLFPVTKEDLQSENVCKTWKHRVEKRIFYYKNNKKEKV